MSKDQKERRTYRKSPGRQYGYDYDPLKSRTGGSHRGTSNSKTGVLLERPNPKRTRQLMRQSIIASKRNSEETSFDGVQPDYDQPFVEATLNTHAHLKSHQNTQALHLEDSTAYRPGRRGYRVEDPEYDAIKKNRHQTQTKNVHTTSRYQLDQQDYVDNAEEHFVSQQRRSIPTRRLIEEEYQLPESDLGIAPDELSQYWYEHAQIDPDQDNDDFQDHIAPFKEQEEANKYPGIARRFSSIGTIDPLPKTTRYLDPEITPEYPEEDENYAYEYEEEHPSVRPTRRKRKVLSRRGLIIGAGAVGVAAVGVAAYDLVPKVPTLPTVANNVEKQVADAFNKGVTQGANQARKDLINSLDTLEGFSLDGAITAARLTRIAYDVFVSPIVKFGSAITSDFLNGMLSAFKTARQWLQSVSQDNATLAAIENVLSTWVTQVNTMPKQLDTITETDLDGAQSYLRALQRKINDEKNQLNNPSATATSTATTTPTAKK